MAGSNDFLPLGTASGANVITQAAWAALTARTTGFAAGLAKSAEVNKALRQATFVAAAIAQWMANQTNLNIVDDGNQAAFVTNFIKALAATGRVRLTGNLTVYVATTGNDSTNTGLTVGSPFLTLQHAWSYIQQNYDLNGYSATVQVADGTYNAGVSCNSPITGQTGASSVLFVGNAGTPSNVIINVPANSVGLACSLAASCEIQGFKFTSSGQSAAGLYASGGGTIYINGPLEFGAFTGTGTPSHMLSDTGGLITILSGYTISGGAWVHYSASGRISSNIATPVTVTLTGTPAFSGAFALAQYGGALLITSSIVTFSGSATGTRYSVTQNAVIVTGGGANYFPGNVAGGSATGGQYS